MRVHFRYVFFLALCFNEALAQISIPASGLVTQNFNSIGTSNTASLPANWKMSGAGLGATANWADVTNVTATTVAAATGTPTTGGRYNWGTSTTERAIGFMTSVSYVSPNSIMAFYRNTSGATITDLTIMFEVERYRRNLSTFQLEFFTSTDGVNWTSQPAGDINTSVFATGASAYTFTNPNPTIAKIIKLTGLSLPNNGDFYLRWIFTNTGNADAQGLGLDNVIVANNQLANPDIPTNSCPYSVILVLDESGSIVGEGGGGAINISAQVRAGASQLIDSLNGTGTRVAVVEFNTNARRGNINSAGGLTTGYQIVDNTYVTNFNTYIQAGSGTASANNYDPEDYATTQYTTNWEAGLTLVRDINNTSGDTADLVIFFTDGQPNTILDNNGNAQTGQTTETALAEAVGPANAIKNQGSHIFVVGIPNSVLAESVIPPIADFDRYPDLDPSFVTGDYSVSTPASLAGDLARLALQFCNVDLNLTKTANDLTPCIGDTVIFTLTISNNALDNSLGVVVTDTLPNGFTYLSDNGGAATTQAGGTVSWNIDTVLANETQSIQISTIVNVSGNYTNIAQVVSYSGEDIILTNNQDTITLSPTFNCTDNDPCTNDFCGRSSINCFQPDGISTEPFALGWTYKEYIVPTGYKIDSIYGDFDRPGHPVSGEDFIFDFNGTEPFDYQTEDSSLYDHWIDLTSFNFIAPGVATVYLPVNSDAIWIDFCIAISPIDGSCVHIPIDCDDNEPCTIDTCDNGTCLNTRIICEDNNSCTIDECIGGQCEYTLRSDSLVIECPEDLVVNPDADKCGAIVTYEPPIGVSVCDAFPCEAQWARRGGSTGTDFASGVGIDPSGNIFIGGGFNNTANFNGINLVSAGGSDIFIAKYDSSGNILWAKRAGGAGTPQYADGLAVDDQGNAYLCGWFAGTAAFDGVSLTSASGSSDLFMAKYDASGNIVWAVRGGGNDLDRAFNVRTSGQDVYVTGYFTGNVTIGTANLTGDGDADIFLAKYKTDGTFVWAKKFSSTLKDEAYGIAIKDDKVYLSGFFSGTATFGSLSVISFNARDFFIAQLDSAGDVNWVRRAGGTGDDQGGTLIVDDAGANVYVTGLVRAPVTFEGVPMNVVGDADIFLAKYDNSGGLVWVRGLGSAGSDVGLDLQFGSNNNIIVGGLYGADIVLGTDTFDNRGNLDVFVAKYDISGNFLSIRTAGAAGNDVCYNLDAKNGKIYAAGFFNNTVNFGSTQLTSAGGDDAFLWRLCEHEITTELVSGLGSGAFFPEGTTTETYVVYDDEGHSDTCSFNVTVLSGCDDNDACTTDTCIDGDCQHILIACDDQDACTTDICVNGQCRFSPIVCNDQNFCTTDACANGQCEYTPIVCNDQNACTTDGCNPQTGCTATPVDCNDNNACTTDGCNPQAGCTSTLITCTDNNLCTIDLCNPQTGCVFNPIICNDQNACTADGCNPQTGCTTTLLSCNDQNACTLDSCDEQAGCFYTTVNCDDSNACTLDSCNEQDGCFYTPLNCNDQNACTNDVCNPSTGCTYASVNCDDGNACTNETCNPSSGCIYSAVNCNDQNACTLDSCDVQSGCFYTTVNCDDGNACTLDSCDVQTGCFYTTVSCNDGNACTIDNCNPQNGCFYASVNCNDQNACTLDSCDILTGCFYTSVNCNDANACTSEICNPSTGCIYSAVNCNDQNACTLDSCDVQSGCFYTTVNCDDRDACTLDSCDEQTGCFYSPVNCDDNNACTIDVCTPQTGCTYFPVNCDDENACTLDSCDVQTGCFYTLVNCDDQNACTLDSCDEQAGCFYTTVNCDDGNVCTLDSCDIQTGCFYTPVNCDDQDVCTVDNCNPQSGCFYIPFDCNDLDPCTIDECISPTVGCLNTLLDCADTDLCTTDKCLDGICVHIPVNCNDGDDCTIDLCVLGQCTFTLIDCGDGDLCTNDTCISGTCLNPPVDCDDQNVCTDDFCQLGECFHTPIPNCCLTVADCIDSDPCSNELCNANRCFFQTVCCDDNDGCTWDFCENGGCVFVAKYCFDNDPCTDDACINDHCTFPPLDCDDDEPCTLDSCNAGICTHTTINCNDQNPCTRDYCNTQGICQHNQIECDDANPCTTDTCVLGPCFNTPIECDDENLCTTDACANGECVFTPVDCDDENLCTIDNCVQGSCSNVSVPCDDGDLCTFDICTDGTCTHPPVPCEDEGNLCTIEQCVNGICQHNPVSCSDGNNCTLDVCSLGVCSHTAVVCNDQQPCTVDACVDGECVFTPLQISAEIQKTDVSCNCGSNQLCLLNFANQPAGTILGEQYAGQGIHISADANSPGKDAAIVFNTFATGTPDPDLEVDAGNIMVIARDLVDINPANGLVDKPNDNATGGTITLLFDYPRSIESFVFIDEEENSTAVAYDGLNQVIGSVTVPALGNASIQTVPFNFSGVRKLVFFIDGSGGVTDIKFTDCCCDGSITANGLGGVPPYTYSWSTRMTTAGIDHLCEGTYCVTVNDANRCQTVECIAIIKGGTSCDDNNECTEDLCANSQCIHNPIPGCGECFEITGFTLVKDGFLGDIGPLTNGMTLDKDVLCKFNIRAEFCGSMIQSVKFVLNGNTFRIENDVPYALAGDNPTGDYHIWSPAVGNYTLTATPYDQNLALGNAGAPMTISFNVIDSNPGSECNPLSTDCNGDINGTAFIDDCDVCAGGNTGVVPNSCFCQSEVRISAQELPAFCQGSFVNLVAIGPSHSTYSWSSGETTMMIEGNAGLAYSVTLTDGRGCTAADTYTVPFQSDLLSAYVMIAKKEVFLDEATVFSGGVGVTNNPGKIRMEDGALITAPTTFARAVTITQAGGSVAAVQILAPTTVALPAFEQNTTLGGPNINVPANSIITLNGTVYGDITIGKNSTVTFTQMTIDMQYFISRENVTVKFAAPCVKIRIKRQFYVGKDNFFNPDSSEVVIHTAQDAKIWDRSIVIADIYTLKQLEVEEGTPTSPTTMIGFYLASNIISEEHTHWYINPACGCRFIPAAKLAQNENTDAGEQPYAVMNEQVSLKAYPNPFNERLNIEFSLAEDSKATLELFSISGQKITTLFEGFSQVGEKRTLEYTPRRISNGIIIYRLKTEYGIYHGKAVMVK